MHAESFPNLSIFLISLLFFGWSGAACLFKQGDYMVGTYQNLNIINGPELGYFIFKIYISCFNPFD